MKAAAEIMSRSFYAIAASDSISSVLHEMSERGLGSVPVLDLAGRPLGMATLAEIERCHDMEEVTDRLTCPVVTVHESTPVDVAARTLGLHCVDSVLVVDDHGVAVGALTALGLLRSLLGLNGLHAEALRAAHEVGGAVDLLEVGAAHRAPEAPGIILLSTGLDEGGQRVVWVEAADNMRERLDQMLRSPQDDERLESLLDVFPRTLRFQCLTVFDEQQRKHMAESLSGAGAARQRAMSASVQKAAEPLGASCPTPAADAL